MRTIETTIYKYSELSPEEQEKAYERYVRITCENEGYFHGEDAIASIKALAEHFGGRVSDYSIDWLEPGRCKGFIFDMPDDMPVKEIKSRLAQLGKYNKKTGKGLGECKLTGVCFDENCIDGFREAFREGERDLTELMNRAGSELQSACMKDFEYQLSAEAFAEDCKANEWEFTVDGKMV